MGEVTREEIITALRALNARASEGRIQLYADAFLEYRTAQENIATHGPIVQHPRTGQPITNPYMAIRNAAAKTIRDLRLNDTTVWT